MIDAISGILAKTDILSDQKRKPDSRPERQGKTGEGFDTIFKEECRRLRDERR